MSAKHHLGRELRLQAHTALVARLDPTTGDLHPALVPIVAADTAMLSVAEHVMALAPDDRGTALVLLIEALTPDWSPDDRVEVVTEPSPGWTADTAYGDPS